MEVPAMQTKSDSRARMKVIHFKILLVCSWYLSFGMNTNKAVKATKMITMNRQIKMMNPSLMTQ
jgi:hypothetical protein